MVPVGPTADGAASYSAVQLRRGPRTAHGPSWSRGRRCPAEHAARCRSCRLADGVVNQVGPSGTAHGSSELVKAHTPRRGRHSCRNMQALHGSRYCIPSTRFNTDSDSPSWSRCRRFPAEHAARCRTCGVADGVVNQVGPSGTAHGSSELVKDSKPTPLAEVDIAVATRPTTPVVRRARNGASGAWAAWPIRVDDRIMIRPPSCTADSGGRRPGS